jgi:thiol-disulfide isomerase/thioredoxin
MTPLRKRRGLWACMIVVGLLVLVGFIARASLFKLISGLEGGELAEIREDWIQARQARSDARDAAKSASDRQAVEDEYSAKERQSVDRCVAYARAHAGTADEIRALKLVACFVPESETGKQAFKELTELVSVADLGVIESGFGFPVRISDEPLQRLVPILLDRIKNGPDDPHAARLLASIVCKLTAEGHQSHLAPANFEAAADLLVDRYADSPDIENFCEIIRMHAGGHTWAGVFEKHLRTILARNHDRKVRVAASFALANVVQAAGESRQLEAQQLYQEFVNQFDGSVQYTDDGKWYVYAGVEKDCNRAAKQQLLELRARGLGKPTPEIMGIDLDGKPIRLSEFRGKVVLLSFWATSCGPCLKLVPYERELLERFEGHSFAIVGVNSDDDPQLAQRTAREHGITWRCFRNNSGHGRAITADWQITALPMFYLIDKKGIIKRRWVGPPLREDVHEAVDQLCSAATP